MGDNEIDDVGILYVRHLQNGRTTLKSGRFYLSFDLTNNPEYKLVKPVAFLKTETGRYCPKTLFNLCKSLVVLNLDLVESLNGFPDAIGELLFSEAVQLNLMRDINRPTKKSVCEKRLLLFTEAYSPFMITHLNCPSKPNLVAEPVWSLLNNLLTSSLVKLNLTQCDIEDTHPIIGQFQKFSSLTHLYLANNYITEYGVRMLTLSIRVSEKGPLGLKHLDLSGNSYLSKEGLKFITCAFKSLLILNISRTLINEVDCQSWLNNGFKLSSNDTTIDTFSTQGWATTLIDTWNSFKTPTVFKVSNFYNDGKVCKTRRNIRTDNDLILTRII